MSKDEDPKIGPGWYDVELLSDQIRSSFDVGLRFEITPPTYLLSTGARTPWRATVLTWGLGTHQEGYTTEAATWGRGGAAKTCPAALWTALSNLYDELELRAARAEKKGSPGQPLKAGG